MTATFTLTGRVLDKSKRPVRRQSLVLQANVTVSDATANEVYTLAPEVMTDDNGYLCHKVNGAPDDDPGIELIVGVQYLLRGTTEAVLPQLVFSDGQATAGVLDIADIVPEPVGTPANFADLFGSLEDRIEDLEASGGSSGSITPDPDHPGFFLIAGGALTPDLTHPGFFLIGA